MEKSGDSLQLHHSVTSSSEVSPMKESGAVIEFLKQTSEMQNELQRLHNLSCSGKDEDSESLGGQQWSQINEILDKHNLNTIIIYQDEDMEECPDLKSISEVLWELLADYSAKKRDIDDYKESIRKLRRENKELRRKKQTKNGSERSVFRSFMRRDLNAELPEDNRIMNIITHYEEQKHKLLEDYKGFKEDMERSQKYLKHFQGDLEVQKKSIEKNQLQQAKTEEILHKIKEELAIRSIEELPEAVAKLQQVCLSLPNIEKFIEVVCKATGSDKSQEKTIKTILSWKAKHNKLEEIMTKMQTSEPSLALEKAEAISHFCNLFEVSNVPVKSVVEQVYYFVHEIKLFLSFARKSLGLSQSCSVTKVLEEISKIMLKT